MVRHLLKIFGRGRPDVDWERLADRLDRRPRPVDPELRDKAQDLHRQLTRFLQASDPWMLRRATVDDNDLPRGTDWQWRPRLLRGQISPQAIAAPHTGHALGEDVALWHDCQHRALILRQVPWVHPGQVPGYRLQLETLGFSGSFVSLTLNLPPEPLANLGPDSIIRLDTVIQPERPVTAYARINLVQGPNTETMSCQLTDRDDTQGAAQRADFDLAYAGLGNRPIDRGWLDLIFQSPRMNAITINDALVSRHSRAQA